MNRRILCLIAIFLALSIGLGIAIYTYKKANPTPTPPNSAEQHEPPTSNENNTQQSLPKDNVHRVEFKLESGTLIAFQDVDDGADVLPPKVQLNNGLVFQGWSVPLNNITTDTTAILLYQDIRNMDNVIVAESDYTSCKSEISITVGVYGKVNLCGIDFCVEYDNEKLKWVGFENEDGSVIINCEESEGTVYINYTSIENSSGEIDFCDLIFEAIINDRSETELKLNVNSIVAIENEKIIIPKYKTIVGKIIILEVIK